MLVWAAWQIVGIAAVPVGTWGTYDNAHGNTATCTAQGFFLQFCGQSVHFYYTFLAVYAWAVIVWGSFDPNRYGWIEPYLHVAVHVYPLGSSIYLLFVESFNSTGLQCWVASVPFGCGDDRGIECTRGPQNVTATAWATGDAIAVFCMVFGTVAMLALTIRVGYIHYSEKKLTTPHQRRLYGMTPGIVCRQSILYISAMYITCIPMFLFYYQKLYYDGGEVRLGFAIANQVLPLFAGLWIALVYWFFSFKGGVSIGRPSFGSTDEITTAAANARNSLEDSGNDNGGHGGGNRNNSSRNRGNKKKLSKRYTFNIFDGTNLANSDDSPFAQFLFDGDEDDAAYNDAETEHWAGCQQVN